MAKKFIPTLVIGLGGTGHRAVVKLKRLMQKNGLGELPVIKYLVFDCDTDEVIGSMSAAEMEPNEFFHITVKNAAAIIREAHPGGAQPLIGKWIPKDFTPNDIKDGAGQIRPSGRLSVFWNCQIIISAIAQALNQVTQIGNEKRMKDLGFELTRNDVIDVYIVSSVCGGTGSGTFLDIAYLTRQACLNAGVSKINSTGIMVMAGAWTSGTRPVGMEANAYAALKELDYFMDKKTTFSCHYPSLPPVTTKEKPFDICYLVDSINANGRKLADIEEVTEMISDAAFLMIGTQVGKSLASPFDNIKPVLTNYEQAKNTAYSGLGTSAIEYPTERILKINAFKLGQDIIENLLMKDKDWLKQSDNLADTFINKNQLDEENSDQLIDRIILKPDGSRINIIISPNRYDEISDKELSQKILNDGQYYETQAMSQIEGIMKANETQISDAALNALNEEIIRILNDPALGVEVACRCLEHLKGDFDRYTEMMKQEKQSIDMQVEQLRSKIRNGQNELETVIKSWNLIGKKGRIRESRDSLVRGVQALLNNIIDERRRTIAITIYSNLQSAISRLRSRIDKVKNQLDMVCQDIRAKYKNQLSIKERKGVLVTSIIEDNGIVALYDEYIKDIAKEKATFLSQYGPLVNFEHLSIDEIIGKVIEYAKERFRLVLGQSIDDFIAASKDKVNIPSMVDDIIFKAAPYWNYNPAMLQHGGNVKQIVVLGVEDREKSMVVQEFKGRPFGAEEDNVSSTGDKDRITILNTVHGLPLFAISQMQNYRYSYDQVRESGAKPLHIAEDFASFPSIEPGEDTGLLNFALACAFNFIIQSGANYVYKLEDDLAEPVMLGKGREKSAVSYGTRKDLTGDTTTRIEKKMVAEGVNSIITGLQKYYDDNLKIAMEQPSTGYKEHLKKELRDIKTYIDELQQ
ncbi:MAG: tubulin-like doman-containing protein [Candidatus Eremiobacterota bacterium]